jgi:hypothetical protein
VPRDCETRHAGRQLGTCSALPMLARACLSGLWPAGSSGCGPFHVCTSQLGALVGTSSLTRLCASPGGTRVCGFAGILTGANVTQHSGATCARTFMGNLSAVTVSAVAVTASIPHSIRAYACCADCRRIWHRAWCPPCHADSCTTDSETLKLKHQSSHPHGFASARAVIGVKQVALQYLPPGGCISASLASSNS